ncbi:MAG: hypothetical protein UY96_C0017G0042 [Parcubacteria group bacterium GW2011_GWB1_56_8]|nr:MAG: hypothetical protein UY96_C0017G0042 [Parcubacteria group bacterium GW2011_GWB1_56_8]
MGWSRQSGGPYVFDVAGTPPAGIGAVGEEAIDSDGVSYSCTAPAPTAVWVRLVAEGQQAVSFVLENRTDDPGSPATGQMWLRTDL